MFHMSFSRLLGRIQFCDTWAGTFGNFGLLTLVRLFAALASLLRGQVWRRPSCMDWKKESTNGMDTNSMLPYTADIDYTTPMS